VQVSILGKDEAMSARKYPEEIRQRAVRMVLEVRKETGERRGAIARVSHHWVWSAETLRNWVA
jgi:transposase